MDRLIISAGADAPLAEALSGRGNIVLTVTPVTRAVLYAIDGAETHELICELPVGLFGAGHGASAVLEAAADRPWGCGAVVVMNDVFEPSVLERLRVPALLLTRPELRPLCQLVHEHCEQAAPRDVHEAARLARAWFERHVGAAQREPWSPGADWYGPGEPLDPTLP